MAAVHTHYDNLKVSRNAPPEVIKAAYRALAQKYHPDKQPMERRNDAARVMQLVNEAFEVLSEPSRRAEHDEWIALQESRNGMERPPPQDERAHSRGEPPPSSSSSARKGKGTSIWHAFIWGGVALSVFALADKFTSSPKTVARESALPPAMGRDPANVPQPIVAQLAAGPTTESPPGTGPWGTHDKVVPATAPPSEWPRNSGLLPSKLVLAQGGLSELTIDNSRNDADVYVKLYDVNTNQAVRHIFIRAGDAFATHKLRAGSYEVRYKDLESGQISASKPFALEERREAEGTVYSRTSMTLYKVTNGNMQMRRLAESDF